MAEPTQVPTPPTVTVVATSAYQSIDFYLNLLIAFLALFAGEFKDLVPVEYLRYILLASAGLNILVKQLQTRPTTLAVLPGSVQAQQVAPIPVPADSSKP